MMSDYSMPVLVLGMHRSGTSYLASRLAAFGLQLGTHLVGAQKGNPHGHFEDAEMLAFHEELLKARLSEKGRAFDEGMMQVEPLVFEPTAEEEAKARSLLEAREQVGLWGWKEPRTSLFIDFWKKHLPKLKGIVIYRHPWAVHDSMRRREHWDLLMFPDQVLKSYSVYNECLCRAIETDPDDYLVINAEAAFSQMDELDERISAFLGTTIDTKAAPVFYPKEFDAHRLGTEEHALIRAVAPQAIAVFERLDRCSKMPYVFKSEVADKRISFLLEYLEAEKVTLNRASSRGLWIPLIEELMLSPADSSSAIELRAQMAEAMGEKIRNMYAWHKQAEKIFKEAEWVEAERKRLSAFLEKQTADYQKIWGELTKVGDGWKKQKEYIEYQTREIERLKAIIAEGNETKK